ncbi:PREDICTED: UDP-glucuronosyltransferase 1-1-like [Chaetura pelagica]|uniref:UDP-glucuronosyltransferase 1-1-like n=1 Tax=Chaetura pelagica TaxID=8897 RepID=UPI00052386C8|nr:PREDICTED: UDP-glucuronosyltransferase 1-1-like [Chaetura pelagica]
MAQLLCAPLQVTTTLVLLLSMLHVAAGGKLLVVPADGSHWLSMTEVLDQLSLKGHEIVVLAPEHNLYIKPRKSFVMKSYPVSFTQEELEHTFWKTTQNAFFKGSLLERILKNYEGVKNTSVIFLDTCSRLLDNNQLIRYLEESKFDAIFTDPILPCGQILAEHLAVPSVAFLQQMPCGLEFEATQCPNPPSYIPRVFTDLADRMTFFQRVKNLLFDFPNFFMCDVLYQPYETLASKFLHREVTVTELLSHVSIWVLKIDFVLHYPRPLMPNMILTGGVNCAHKKLTQVDRALLFLVILAGSGRL